MITLSQHKDLSHASRELNVAQRLMSLICGSHQLETARKDQLDFHYSGIRLPSKKMAIGCISYGTDVSIQIQQLGAYSISLPIHGQQTLRMNGETHLSHSNNGIIVSSQDQQELIIHRNCKKFQVVIPEESVKSVLSNLLSKPVKERVIFEPDMPFSEDNFLRLWWNNIQQCLSLRQDYSRFDGLNLLSQDYESFLIKALLLTQQNNYSNELRSLQEYQLPKPVMVVREFIHRFADQELDASDLVMISGTSKSTLYREFQQALHMSPMDYLKNYRLEQIHHALLQNNANISISRLAYDWGFRHLGRFSQEYKAKYGVLPSETLKIMV